MAKTAAQPKTMESNHKVASVLSTGLFAILCVLIAFPLLAGFFASFQEGREAVSYTHLDVYKRQLLTPGASELISKESVSRSIFCPGGSIFGMR